MKQTSTQGILCVTRLSVRSASVLLEMMPSEAPSARLAQRPSRGSQRANRHVISHGKYTVSMKITREMSFFIMCDNGSSAFSVVREVTTRLLFLSYSTMITKRGAKRRPKTLAGQAGP